jgi:hypothetical protein
MIRIIRATLPDELASRLITLTHAVRKADPQKRTEEARKIWRRSSTRTNVHEPLSQILRQMAVGLEQCMYCGEDESTGIDHFDPIAHNPLRTFDWLNHLLACTICNSHRKRDRFPMDRNNNPLLIDPTSEDPFGHLLLTLSLGYYEPLSDKGKATIDVCDLNRPILQRGRVQAQRVVELCLKKWEDANQIGNTSAMREAVLTVREQPFADVCQAMLRQAEMPGGELIFDDRPGILDLLRTPEVRSALLS